MPTCRNRLTRSHFSALELGLGANGYEGVKKLLARGTTVQVIGIRKTMTINYPIVAIISCTKSCMYALTLKMMKGITALEPTVFIDLDTNENVHVVQQSNLIHHRGAKRVDMGAYAFLYHTDHYLGQLTKGCAPAVENDAGVKVFRDRSYWLKWAEHGNATHDYPLLYVYQSAPCHQNQMGLIAESSRGGGMQVVEEECPSHERRAMGYAKQDYYIPLMNRFVDGRQKAIDLVSQHVLWAQACQDQRYKPY